MTDLPNSRKEAVRYLSHYLRRYKRPRTQLFLILLLTGVVGVLLSYILLRMGMVHMWLRYPVAALIAYMAFLLALRFWAQHQLNRPEIASDLSLHATKPDENKPKPRLSLTLLDLLEMLVCVDDAPVVLLILIGLIVVAAIVVILIAAPMLLAEVLLDGLVVAGLCHRINDRGAIESIGGALRTTWVPVFQFDTHPLNKYPYITQQEGNSG